MSDLPTPSRRFAPIALPRLSAWQGLMSGLAVHWAVRIAAMITVPLTDTTEARYAEIARKMVETSDWITPQFDYGVPFWGKPPLHSWLSAAGMELFGVTPFSARFFIFLTGFGVLWALWRLAEPRLGPGAALICTAILSSSVLFYGAAGFVMTDMVMTMGLSLVMLGIWRGLDHPGPWGLVPFAGLAIGLLAKGPVALVLVTLAVAPWMAHSGRARALRRLPWRWGMLLCLALTLPWYLAAELKTPGFLRYFLIGAHVERCLVPGWDGDLYGIGHERAKGAIWLDWLVTFLPWTPAFLMLLPRARTIKTTWAEDRSGWRVYLTGWVLAPLILFTPSANILAAYVLPGLPAATALLVTLWRDAWGETPGPATRLALALGLCTTTVFGAGLASTALLSPDTLRLRSAEELVTTLNAAAPDAPLYLLQHRSHSAEFYTSGRAQVVEQFAELPGGDQAIGLAVRTGSPEVVELTQDPAWIPLGQHGRHHLFLSRPHSSRTTQETRP